MPNSTKLAAMFLAHSYKRYAPKRYRSVTTISSALLLTGPPHIACAPPHPSSLRRLPSSLVPRPWGGLGEKHSPGDAAPLQLRLAARRPRATATHSVKPSRPAEGV